MGLFKKKEKKVEKVEEPVTSSIQDVTNRKYNIQVVEPEQEEKKVEPEVKDIPAPPLPPPPKPKPGQQQTFNLILTIDQMLKRIKQLELSENMQLYMRVLEGQEEYEELQEMVEALPDEYKA